MNIRKVAIIGGGPKGLYGFERLTAWLKVLMPSERTEIHIYNRSDSFGAGENYRVDQPSWLLMNNPVGEIDMWGKQKPPPVVPQPLSLQEWIYHTAGQYVSGHKYASRAMAGRYLSRGFSLIAANLPENVHGKYIIGEVVDIEHNSGKYQLTFKAEGDESIRLQPDRYDHVLLATGHPRPGETKETLAYRSFAHDRKGAGYIPFVYPVETRFSNIPGGCSVGVKGIGLTFVDAVLALTEGKGGRFERDEISQKLSYIPSGKEPRVIYPFSRTGLPMIPRISVPNVKNGLRFFTRSALQKLDTAKPLNFEQHIQPLLRKEMIYAYYDIAMKNAGHPEGLQGCDGSEDVERFIAAYYKRNAPKECFDVGKFLNPEQETELQKGASHHEYIKLLYHDYLQEARKGELWSPLAAVTAVWRKASSLFCEVYSFGGLTPESHRHFDESVRGKLNRVTFGPPVNSAEKLYALMESGILNFDPAKNPGLILDEKSGRFVLRARPDGTRFPFQYLVDARIPKVNLADNPGSLFGNLLNRGLITLYENRSGVEAYQPGAVNITQQGFVIGRNGQVNHGIAVTGTPTEGITFDNDTLSRDRNNFVDGWAEYVSMEYAKSEREQYANG